MKKSNGLPAAFVSRHVISAAALVAALTSGAAGATTPSPSPSAAPNDPYFSQQWALHNDGTQTVMLSVDDLHTVLQKGTPGVDLGWLEARQEIASRATSPVTVAVIDSGVDPTHPDLQGRISPDSWDFIANQNLISGKAQGLPCGAGDGFDVDNPAEGDVVGHGTHVSGIIAANDDNGIGVTGFAPPSVQILALRILQDDYQNFTCRGRLISDYAADAINYAVAHHASVINMSLGWPLIADSPNARSAVQNAVQNGVLVVAAAGNDHKDDLTFPCAYEGVLCVGSITNTGAPAAYTNFGGNVDILAPGDGVLSTYPLNVESETLRIQGYEILSGTSQASPYIAALAAVLKSANPSITINEIKARIFASAGALPTPNAGLFGLANVGRALDAAPQSMIVPDFRAATEALLDESSLTASGQVPIVNLWKDATNVQVTILANGVSAGTQTAAALAGNATLTVPWQYKFASLDDSSELTLQVQVSANGVPARSFSLTVRVARAIENIGGRSTYTLPAVAPSPGVPVPPRLGTHGSQLYSFMRQVETYPPNTPGVPSFFQVVAADATGTTLQIYDPAASEPLRNLKLPSLLINNGVIAEVIRMDASGAGRTGENRDWVVFGFWEDSSKVYHLQFQFFDPNLQPLYGSDSIWEISFQDTDPYGPNILRAYGAPGSWVYQKNGASGRLLPSYVAQNKLPPTDNFIELDPRYNQTGTHLYYLQPQATPAADGTITLTLRAVDNATFLDAHTALGLQSAIPPSSADMAAGHLRLLVTNSTNLSAPVQLLDVSDVTATPSLTATNGWDSLSAAGQPVLVQPGNSAAFLSFFDSAHGSLSWSTSTGEYLARDEFEYENLDDPIQGLIGAFDFTSSPSSVGDRYWFLQTGFDIAAYHMAPGATEPQSETILMERDSSFPDEESNAMFSPMLVGNANQPLPGVYIDPTLVMGDQVAVAVWSSAGTFSKPLRYSLRVPTNCAQMDPVHLDAQSDSFALPLLCVVGSNAELWMVQPN